MARGYTTLSRVEQHIGRDLEGAQEAEATDLIDAAEAFIDAHTGRAWLMPPQTAEVHWLTGRLTWLRYVPILATPAAVVTGYTDWAHAGTLLVADRDYHLADLNGGVLDLGYAWTTYAGVNRWLTVTYTPSDAPPPADITLAATELVGLWLAPLTEGVGVGIKRYSVGRELSVEYATGDKDTAVPPSIMGKISQHRRRGPL